jgi:hypothetical protein
VSTFLICVSLPLFVWTTGKYYETKHLVPSKKADGKLCRINYSFEDIHIDAPAKVC